MVSSLSFNNYEIQYVYIALTKTKIIAFLDGQRIINCNCKDEIIKIYNKKVIYSSGKNTIKGKDILKEALKKVVD